MRCRICRSARNLKYTPQQLRLQTKDINKNKLRLPLSAIPQTTGNICIDCDERLQNFHQIDDGCDVDVDSNGFCENKNLPAERPIIVDDDKRLFDIFYTKTGLHSNEQVQSLGSDGDAEVIELLTSRETTPDMMGGYPGNKIQCSNAIPTHPTVIDIIDLEDDETDNECKKQLAIPNKIINPEEKQTRLLGCLNLVSSDSESEINFEPCPRQDLLQKNVKESTTEVKATSNFNGSMLNISVECTYNNNHFNCKNSSVTIKHNLPVCEVCGISCIDKQSLQAHINSEHEDFKCLVCNDYFQKPLDIVNHMRQKHRSYDGTNLCEGARCSQDSAMTIRLRFMQRYTFYECQLCGLIVPQFKAHKTHIMQKHADESKSLRDPMMKTQLKCPSCHQNCGTQQLDICRHLISKHEPAEGSKYLKVTTDFKTLGLNKKFLETLQQGVRFLTLGTHNQTFFECLLCTKVFSSTRTISKHLNGHNIDDWKVYRARKQEGTMPECAVDSRIKLKRKIALKTEPSEQYKVVLKKEEQPPMKKPKLEYVTPSKSAVKIKKNTLPKDFKSKSEETKTKKLPPPATIPPNSVKDHIFTHSDMKRQKKLKRKQDKKLQSKKGHQAVTKVKVKPPLRHFPTQKYNCKYCQVSFKGFRKLQLHLLSSHRSEEYHSCESCSRAFIYKSSLEVHCVQKSCKRKRKCTNISLSNSETKQNDNLDENFNKDIRKPCNFELKPAGKEPTKHQQLSATSKPLWLKELLELSKEKKLKNINNKNTAIDDNFDESLLRSEREQFNTVVQTFCRYCGKLFTTLEEFSVHEKNHIAHKEMPYVNFSQRNRELNSI